MGGGDGWMDGWMGGGDGWMGMINECMYSCMGVYMQCRVGGVEMYGYITVWMDGMDVGDGMGWFEVYWHASLGLGKGTAKLVFWV